MTMKWNYTGVGGKSIHFYKILNVITSTNFPWNYVCANNDYRCILLHWNIKKECKIKIWCSRTLSRERERERKREERARKSEIDILSVSIYVSKIPNGNIKHKVISSGQSKLDRKCYLFINMWSIYLLHCNLSEYTTHINGCICRSPYTVTIYLLDFYKEFEKWYKFWISIIYQVEFRTNFDKSTKTFFPFHVLNSCLQKNLNSMLRNVMWPSNRG